MTDTGDDIPAAPPETSPRGAFEAPPEMRRKNRITGFIILGVIFLWLALGFGRSLLG